MTNKNRKFYEVTTTHVIAATSASMAREAVARRIGKQRNGANLLASHSTSRQIKVAEVRELTQS